MAELKPCKRCGGMPEFRKEYIETAFGDKPFLYVRCHKCLDRTSRYMVVENCTEKDVLQIVTDLWNRGCVADGK